MNTNSINNTFINALLADATYVDGLIEGNTPLKGSDLVNKLKSRLTPDLAQYLADNFEVVTQKLNGDELSGSDAGSGFDVTVWKSKATGQVYVSTRGTEGKADFVADADLTVFGLAREQVIDMANWWLKSRASAGTMATQIRMAGTTDPVYSAGTIVAATPVPGDGTLSNVTSVVVNGHSLGGHLATAFARLFGGTITVVEVNTFNSANFNPASNMRFAEFSSALGLGSTQFPANQTNFYAAHGPDVTTQNITQGQIGQRVSLFNEESSAAEWLTVPNHFMFKLTDALALGASIEKLDTSLNLSKLNTLLEAGSHQTKATLEWVLDSVRKIVGIEATPLPVGDAGDSPDSRKDFHAALAQLQVNTTFKALAGKLKFELVHDASIAKTDFAAFLSLQAGAAFSLRLKNSADSASEAQLYAANRAAYEPWLADKTLRNQNGDLSKLNFTDTYLNDRSAYANTLIERNIKDIGGIVPNRQNLRFYDSATDTQILAGAGSSNRSIISFGDGKANPLDGGAVNDRLYGGAGSDTLDGKAGNDYLEGGTGTDTLIGGAGDDVLIGGKEADTYQFEGLWGNDTITDADGLGNITIAGQAINGLTQVQDNVWENASKTLVLTQVIAGAASAASGGQPVTNLIIGQRTSPGSGSINATITVNNWKDGNLGITLGTQTKNIDNNGFVVADAFTKEGTEINEGGFFGESQHWIRSADAVSGPITIDAGKGNDLIGGNSQAETISGGSGNDFIAGGGGKDILLGGAGFDWIVADASARPNGGLDKDGNFITSPTFAQAYTPTDQTTLTDSGMQGYSWAGYFGGGQNKQQASVPTSGQGNGYSMDTSDVFIDGGDGSDHIWSSAGNDILLGGEGAYRDFINGGYGDDLIIGGEGSDALSGDDIFYNLGDEYSQHGQLTATYLDIDSKLLRIYAGDTPISVLKQLKNSCKTTRSSCRASIFREKQADRRYVSLMVCYGNRSKLRQNISLPHAKAGALTQAGARHG
jgi:trimeric autotransporter adhesin